MRIKKETGKTLSLFYHSQLLYASLSERCFSILNSQLYK